MITRLLMIDSIIDFFLNFLDPLFTSEVELKRKFPTFCLNYRLKKFRSFGKIILLLVKMDPKSFFTDQLRVKSTDVPSLPHFAGASLILVLTMAFFSLQKNPAKYPAQTYISSTSPVASTALRRKLSKTKNRYKGVQERSYVQHKHVIMCMI